MVVRANVLMFVCVWMDGVVLSAEKVKRCHKVNNAFYLIALAKKLSRWKQYWGWYTVHEITRSGAISFIDSSVAMRNLQAQLQSGCVFS